VVPAVCVSVVIWVTAAEAATVRLPALLTVVKCPASVAVPTF